MEGGQKRLLNIRKNEGIEEKTRKLKSYIKIYIDEKQYITLPITKTTTIQDAIDFVKKRRFFNSEINVGLKNGKIYEKTENLYELINNNKKFENNSIYFI